MRYRSRYKVQLEGRVPLHRHMDERWLETLVDELEGLQPYLDRKMNFRDRAEIKTFHERMCRVRSFAHDLCLTTMAKRHLLCIGDNMPLDGPTGANCADAHRALMWYIASQKLTPAVEDCHTLIAYAAGITGDTVSTWNAYVRLFHVHTYLTEFVLDPTMEEQS